jgi:Flp pilus assembly protein TadG
MSKYFHKIWRTSVSDSRGSHAIEFALIAPILFLLVMSAIEFGLLMFTQMALESALGNVARTTTIGNTTGYSDRLSYIRAEFLRQTQGLIHSENIVISSEVVSSQTAKYIEPEMCLTKPPRFGNCPADTAFVDNNGNGVYDGGSLSNDLGKGGDLVQMNVALPWTFFTPIVGRFFRSDQVVGQNLVTGTYVIRTSAVIKNEPF